MHGPEEGPQDCARILIQGTPEFPDWDACNECMTGEWQAVRALGMYKDR